MLFLIGFGLMLIGIIVSVVVARKGMNRSGDMLGDMALGAINAMDAGIGSFSGSSTQQAVSNGFSASITSMLKSQLKVLTKNWKLFLAGSLGLLAVIIGLICMGIWIIHFLWTLFF